MNWNWREEGFRTEPKRIVTWPGLRLYRVWGGTSTKLGNPSRPGVCFSTQRPLTRLEAERLFSVFEWGNSCQWLTEFRVTGHLELFVGAVHPGDYVDPLLADPRVGVQVFVENPLHGKLCEGQTTRLGDDRAGMHFHPGSQRAQ